MVKIIFQSIFLLGSFRFEKFLQALIFKFEIRKKKNVSLMKHKKRAKKITSLSSFMNGTVSSKSKQMSTAFFPISGEAFHRADKKKFF